MQPKRHREQNIHEQPLRNVLEVSELLKVGIENKHTASLQYTGEAVLLEYLDRSGQSGSALFQENKHGLYVLVPGSEGGSRGDFGVSQGQTHIGLFQRHGIIGAVPTEGDRLPQRGKHGLEAFHDTGLLERGAPREDHDLGEELLRQGVGRAVPVASQQIECLSSDSQNTSRKTSLS